MRYAPLTAALSLIALASTSYAQFGERPSLMGSGANDVDCSGRSIKNKRVRAVHGDSSQVGSSGYFMEKDPFLAFQLGRNLVFREFRDRDGTFDARLSPLIGPMPDGTTSKITANNQTSCSGCHNVPTGNPGGAANFSKDSGFGRNSPHFYGSGIMEMLALQIRAEMLQQIDSDNSGWVSAAEAQAAGSQIFASPGPGATPIDFGRPSLGGGLTGRPALNNIFRVWFVDDQGRVVPGASQVDGVNTHGYNFEMIVWGWGQGRGRNALNPTNRAFLWDPWKAHGGLEAYDPSTNQDLDQDGISDAPTLPGALQFPVSHSSPDKGTSLDPTFGFSTDDPDGDGHLNEISEGDLDLAEFYMLNVPRPAFAGTAAQYAEGVDLLERMSCTQCHVESWTIREADGTFDGDRRHFDLDVRWNNAQQRLQGRLVTLYDRVGDSYVPKRESYTVPALFTDFRHHEMGPGFTEIDFGGTENTLWRTPPLWGVGSGFPWGHDGMSLTLRDVILRHGGEAQLSRDRFVAAGPEYQEALINFLRKLQLYDIETLPSDVDGDGAISGQFMVAGKNTGIERFNAEWLFKVPLQIQGMTTNINNVQVRSFAGVNIDDAYGQNLPFRIDSDDDGWPDVWDHQPNQVGYKDGVN